MEPMIHAEGISKRGPLAFHVVARHGDTTALGLEQKW